MLDKIHGDDNNTLQDAFSFQIQVVVFSSIYFAMCVDDSSRLHSFSYAYTNMNHVYTCHPPSSSCFSGNCQSLTRH